MPSTDRKVDLKAKTSVAQTAAEAAVYAKGLKAWLPRVILCARVRVKGPGLVLSNRSVEFLGE
jgi:hypothetical protein